MHNIWVILCNDLSNDLSKFSDDVINIFVMIWVMICNNLSSNLGNLSDDLSYQLRNYLSNQLCNACCKSLQCQHKSLQVSSLYFSCKPVQGCQLPADRNHPVSVWSICEPMQQIGRNRLVVTHAIRHSAVLIIFKLVFKDCCSQQHFNTTTV